MHLVDLASLRTSRAATYHRSSSRHNIHTELLHATGFALDAMDLFQLRRLMDIDRIHACNALNGLIKLAYEQGSYVS
jgi:hypothetical protein